VTVLAGVAPRLAAIVAQHGASIAAGALSGALLGGAGVATGVIPTGGAANGAPSRALTACPGSGAVVGRISSGTPLLVIARSADGAWLQVYIGGPGIDSGWASADALKLRDAASSLPVADCGITPSAAPTPGPIVSPAPPPPSQIALPTATAGPSPSPTPKPTRTPKPTPKPTPTPVPTSFKSAHAPVVSALFGYDKCIYTGTTESLGVTVTDADPGDTDDTISVKLRVTPPGQPAIDGPDFSWNGVGSVTFEGYFQTSSSWTTSGVVKLAVIATDASGNVTTLKSSSNSSDPSWMWYENGPYGVCPTTGP
jgi:hypothetical protein